MRLLVDTHIFLWMLQEPDRLSAAMRRELGDPANELYFSAVLAWEIATKRAKGKLVFDRSPRVAARERGFLELAITGEHCEVSADLPLHHLDPFDRLLVAQAQVEGLVLATGDPVTGRYGIRLLKN